MKTFLLTSTFILCSLTVIFSQSNSQDDDYGKILSELENLGPVKFARIPTGGIVIQKDSTVFKLKRGIIYKLSKVCGREVAIFFEGEGQFIYSPPSKVEKEQLERVFSLQKMNEKFSELFLLFADSTNLNFFTELVFNDSADMYFTKSKIEYCLSFLYLDEYGYFDSDFMQAFLNKSNNNLFYAHIDFDLASPLFYKITPYEEEEVTLSKKIPSHFIKSRASDLVNSFNLNDSYSTSSARKNLLRAINISLYKIELKIEDDLNVKGSCEITFDINNPEYKWLRLGLYHELIVDSIKFNGVSTNSFYRAEENPELWINFPEALNSGNKNSLSIYYHGELLEKDEFGLISIQSSSAWYPSLPGRNNSFFDLTFSYPNRYTLVSIGDRTFYDQTGETTVSSWYCEVPAHSASFNIGTFESFEFSEEGVPKVNVYIDNDLHQQLSHQLAANQILSGADMEEKIGTDILASLKFFQTVYGKINMDEIYVTEIPYLHGQAFPGLVHLSWYNYQGLNYDRAGEMMRSHEVAHQWWGIGVDFEDYHDQWLSEGFSEFSALYFVQAGFGNEDYFDILDNWKKSIFSNRKFLLGDGQEAGPIWLGYRTNTSETEGDYSLIVYQKGAWVLHMLRNMLLNLQTMNEDSFSNMMKEFFNSFHGKKATTKDFKIIADKYCKENMQWFFDQFVYGTDLPEYTFSYTTEKLPDGKFQVVCKILQENVPENFKMYVPIKLVLSDERFARLRIEVKGKETIVKLPPIAEEPDEIIFNDLNSVLCEVEYD